MGQARAEVANYTSIGAPAEPTTAPHSAVVPMADSMVVAQTGSRIPTQTAVQASASSTAVPALPLLTPAAAAVRAPPCTNSNALGVSRVAEIDTTGGPGFGFEHFRQYDFLRPGEVVLTFDDGHWLNTTRAVLKALAEQCVKATFFPIGKHATYYPEILREVYEAGHTVGSHAWSHQDLSKKSVDEGKEEIEKGISAVKAALAPNRSILPLPGVAPSAGDGQLSWGAQCRRFLNRYGLLRLQDSEARPDHQERHGETEEVRGKGIVLMHDFQHGTSDAVPQLLTELKANGYKIVHMTPKCQLDSLAI